MSVYVDTMQAQLGLMKMCHMIADSTEELLQMVDTIGVKRKWIQYGGTYKEHFDICASKRKLAIKAGAIEVSSKQLVTILTNRKKTVEVKPKTDTI